MKMHLSNFTPVLDNVLEKFGRDAALVHGAMLRYSQQSGVCWAAKAKIAKRVGMSTHTVYRCQVKLVEAGLLEIVDAEPGETVRFRVIDTMQVDLSINPEVVESEIGEVQQAQGDAPQTRGDASQAWGRASQAYKDTSKREVRNSTSLEPEEPVQYEDCDEFGEPLKTKSSKSKREKATPPEMFGVAQALAEVTGMSLAINRKQLFAEAKALMADPKVSATLILMTYQPGGIWYKEDWRGKRGGKPTLYQIRETILTFKAAEPEVIYADMKSRPVTEKGGVKCRN